MEFLKMWEIFQRRKRLFLAVFIPFLLVVIFITHFVRPTYKAAAKVLIGAEKNQNSLLITLGIKGLSPASLGTENLSTGYYDTDKVLATSEPLLEEIISALRLKDWRGRRMKPDKLANIGFLRLFKNKLLPQPYIEIDQIKKSRTLEIAAYSTDPVEASNMSNRLAEIYIEDSIKRTQEEFKAARIFIEGQIEKVRDDYYKSLSDLKDFKIKEETVDLTTETSNVINKIATLKSHYEDNEKLMEETERRMEKSREKLRETEKFRSGSKTFSRNDTLQSLETKLNDFLVSLAGKSVDFTREHPEYKNLEREIETVRELISGEAKVVFNSENFSVDPRYDDLEKNIINTYIDYAVAAAKKKLIRKYLNEYHNEMMKIPVKNLGNSRIELALSVNKELYQNTLQYLNQVGIAESMTLSNIKLAEPASVPYKRYFPKRLLNYAVGLFLGIFWGMVVVFFMEYIDNTVKTPSDLKNISSLALLGTIPYSKSISKNTALLNVGDDPNVIEAFRSLKNALRYVSSENPMKSFLITSSTGAEGTSTIASHISVAYSMEGKGVILIDLNLRRPSIHTFFNTRNAVGVANVIDGTSSLEEAITHTAVKGVDILSSGPIPTNPGIVVDSQRLPDIINILKERYDVVIIDTPPVLAVADAAVIGGMVDGVVYNIASGRVAPSRIENAGDRLARARVNLVGVVLNKFREYEDGTAFI